MKKNLKKALGCLLVACMVVSSTNVFAAYPTAREVDNDGIVEYQYYPEGADITQPHRLGYPNNSIFNKGDMIAPIATYVNKWDISKKDGESSNNVHNYSDATRRFTVNGKNFLLVDTDEEGNYFVIADDLYGKQNIVAGASGDAYKQKIATGEFRFDTQYKNSLATWLNLYFYNTTKGKEFPEAIKPYILEHEWWTEPGVNVVDPVSEEYPDGYYKTQYGTEDIGRLNGYLSYSTKCKLALLSVYEYFRYYDIISPLVYGSKRVESNGWSADNGAWLLRTVQNTALPTNGNGVSAIFMNVSNGQLDRTNGYNAYNIRPCFWLDKDFFKEVKLDTNITAYKKTYEDVPSETLEIAAGDIVMDEIAKMSVDEFVDMYGDVISLDTLATTYPTVIESVSKVYLAELFGLDDVAEYFGLTIDTELNAKNIYPEGQAIAGNTLTAKCTAADDAEVTWMHSDAKDGAFTVVGTGNTLSLKDKHEGYMKLCVVVSKDGKMSEVKESPVFEVEKVSHTPIGEAITENSDNYNIKTNGNGVWADLTLLDKVYGKDGKAQLFVTPNPLTFSVAWHSGADSNETANGKFDAALSGTMAYSLNSNNFSGIMKVDTVMWEYIKAHNWLTEAGPKAFFETDSYFAESKVAPMSLAEFYKYQSKIGYSIFGETGVTLRTPYPNENASLPQLYRICSSSNGYKMNSRANLKTWAIPVKLAAYLDADYILAGGFDTETPTSSDIYDFISKNYTKEQLLSNYTSEQISAMGVKSEDKIASVDELKINGSLLVGQTVTADYTYVPADNEAEDGTTYQWYVLGASGVYEPIEGATNKSYTLTTAEMGRNILVEVTPANGLVKTAYTGAVVQTEIVSGESASVAITSFTGNSADVTYSITTGEAMTYKGIIAFYGENNRLIDVKYEDINAAEGTGSYPLSFTTLKGNAILCKAMLWKDGITPVCESDGKLK